MKFLTVLPIALCIASSASAEQIIVQSSEAVKIIRCNDMFGIASCEFISSTSEMLKCVAFDANDEPIASASAFGDGTSVEFMNLDASKIAKVLCSE